MKHDPLCRQKVAEWEDKDFCSDCSLIAKVRKDERKSIFNSIVCVCGVGEDESINHLFGCPYGAAQYVLHTLNKNNMLG